MEKVFGIIPLQLIVLGLLASSPRFFAWRDKRDKKRRPLEQKLLRAPGSFLVQRLETLNDRLIFWVAILAFGPAVLLLSLPKSQDPAGLVIAAVLISASGVQLYRSMNESRRFKLGLLGERTVAEELNKLMFDGCHVFHDYPAGRRGNIDHIIVAPSGVYAIETKTWTKRASPGRRDHYAEFDGEKLNLPWGWDTKALDQTRDNAAYLSDELSKATATKVLVTPILTLPGWFIPPAEKSTICVLNPKCIRTEVLQSGKKPVLSAELVHRIASRIELSCRNVVI